MRILHIIPNLKKGGAERLVLDICIEISKREGYDIYLVSLAESNDYKELSDKINYRAIPSKAIPSISSKPQIEIDELLIFINQFKPDIIHSHLFEAELVSHWQLINGITYITHCHDNMKQLQNCSFKTLISKQLLIHFYEKNILLNKYLKSSNSFIAISKHTESFFKKSLSNELRNRISLLPNAIMFDRFNSVANSKTAKSSTIKLVNVGLIIPKKNQQFLLSIVAKLKVKGFDIQLTLLGFGYEFDKIKNLAQSMGIDKDVIMPGNVNNVEEYLSKSDIYVHSAYYEPFGLVLLEAMAAGLPVVCLDGGGNRDIIENGKNGFIIKDQNVDEFVERILELHNNQNLYTEISLYAQQYAMQYDIKPYVDKLLEIYHKAPACKL